MPQLLQTGNAQSFTLHACICIWLPGNTHRCKQHDHSWMLSLQVIMLMPSTRRHKAPVQSPKRAQLCPAQKRRDIILPPTIPCTHQHARFQMDIAHELGWGTELAGQTSQGTKGIQRHPHAYAQLKQDGQSRPSRNSQGNATHPNNFKTDIGRGVLMP